MNKCVLFDIDGTLTDTSHRLYLIQEKPKRFNQFMKELINDPVIDHVVDVANGLKAIGYTILLCTARDEGRRVLTETHFTNNKIDFYDKIYMRPEGDHRPDMDMKRILLAKIREDGYNPTMVFEDRKRCCDMWREEGLFVFDVGNGIGDF